MAQAIQGEKDAVSVNQIQMPRCSQMSDAQLEAPPTVLGAVLRLVVAIPLVAGTLTGCDKPTAPADVNTPVTATVGAYNASSCVPVPLGIVTWLPANDDPHDIIGINNGTLTHGASYAAGVVAVAVGTALRR
ncbi:MAG: hypothetical protein ACT4P6_14770 [Gemmatimonadaceae bacterium]